MAEIDYFEDDSLHGNYQYITLDTLVNEYMASLNPDDYMASTTRFRVVMQAKAGLKELYYDVLNEIKAIELELSPNLTVVVPPDFVNWVRVSWVDEHGILHPMATDSRMNLAIAYLQDNNYNILFDNDGNILKGSGVRDTVTDETEQDVDNHRETCRYTFSTPYTPNVNLSYNFPNGKFRFDRSRGVFEFGSGVFGKNIVLEYISDGMYNGDEGTSEADLRIHKFADKALRDFITYELIKNNRNVPNYEKIRARKEWFNSRRLTIRRISTLRRNDLLQAMKGSSKNIKL